MAYREFDPTKIEEYKNSTIGMFNEQNEFAASKITSLTAKISSLNEKKDKLEKEYKALEKQHGTIKSSYVDAKGITHNEYYDNTSKMAEVDSQISDVKDEIEKAEKAVTALEKVQGDIAKAIAQTKSFVGDLLANVGNTDAKFEQNFNKLIDQINEYKKNMKDIYNSVDTTLREHGYNKNVNIKNQFSNTVDDFADSTMINHFPYIPERYIYHGGELNERILNGIFGQNVDDVGKSQINELSKVMDTIGNKSDWNNLGKFISAGYSFTGTMHSDVGSDYRKYELSEVFQKFGSDYYNNAKRDMVNSIIKGTSLVNLSKNQTLKLQLGALLTSFASQMPTMSANASSSEGFKGIHKLEINVNQSNRGSFNGLEVSLKDPFKLFGDTKWFVSDFNSDLGTFLPNFRGAVASDQLKNFYIDCGNDFGNLLLSWMIDAGIGTAGDLLDAAGKKGDAAASVVGYGMDIADFIKEQNEKKVGLYNTIDASKVEAFFTKMRFGGILIQGKDNDIIINNNIMELNGSEGLGMSMEAYYYKNGLDSKNNVTQYYRWYNEPNFTGPVENAKTIGNVFDWLAADDTSGRYVTGHGTDYRVSYNSAVISVAGSHGIKIDGSDSNYQDYKKIIETYPDEIDAFMNS